MKPGIYGLAKGSFSKNNMLINFNCLKIYYNNYLAVLSCSKVLRPRARIPPFTVPRAPSRSVHGLRRLLDFTAFSSRAEPPSGARYRGPRPKIASGACRGPKLPSFFFTTARLPGGRGPSCATQATRLALRLGPSTNPPRQLESVAL